MIFVTTDHNIFRQECRTDAEACSVMDQLIGAMEPGYAFLLGTHQVMVRVLPAQIPVLLVTRRNTEVTCSVYGNEIYGEDHKDNSGNPNYKAELDAACETQRKYEEIAQEVRTKQEALNRALR